MHNTPLCSVVYNTPPSLQPRARLHHLQYHTNDNIWGGIFGGTLESNSLDQSKLYTGAISTINSGSP